MARPDRAEAILAAAQELFVARGFRATTMEAIARAAGVAKPTLYARFPDKETLLRVIGERVVSQARDSFAAALREPGDPVERARSALRTKYRAMEALLGDSPHALELHAEFARIAPETITDLHRLAQENLTILLTEAGVSDPAERAEVVLAAVDGLRERIADQEKLVRLVDFTVAKLLA
ncbi:TetR/AcrR family transcriptional regulator [Granulicoccus phenolivorans]|uniref:TetR/AcrR family transcriptional regulator n=1 Tax=Granulicoccus phenolivorans TaxID=266854 RepID=UPI0003F5BEC7|nr:TetR/AcrR family transcriptional regulator [Granulicoccus phenolivorans]